MADMPSDRTAGALIEFLHGRHAEMMKQIEGLEDAGVNWRFGVETTPILEIVNHALDAERGFVTTVAGTPPQFERTPNGPGTTADAVRRIQQADADVASFLGAADKIDLERDVYFYRRDMPAVLALSLGVGHLNEHLGQLQLTRQLWDQYGKTGVLKGVEG